jgi:hypothetical protein
VTAIRRAGFFDDRVELVRNPLAYGLAVVPLSGGELVTFDRAGPGGYNPEDQAWLDLIAVSGPRVLGRDALASRGVNVNNDPVAPTLMPVASGALAVWAFEDEIAYSSCSLEGCGERHDVAAAGRGERLELAGAGAGAIAWLEGRDPLEFELRVGRLEHDD